MPEQPTTSLQPEPVDPRQYDLVLIDQSKDARDAARNEADARLIQELNEGGRFRRMAKSIWKGNIAKDYYRHKYQQQAEQRIVATQDILVHESTSQEHRDSAMYATIQRFQSEYDEMVHQDAGESKQELGQDTELAHSLKSVIRQYADGRLDDAALREERARVLQAYSDENGQELKGDGLVQIDNMLEIAQSVKGAVAHGESLDAILSGMRVVSAESRTGVRSTVEYTKIDRVVEKISNSKIGLLLGSEAAIAAVTIAASVARFGSKRAIGAAAMTIAPGIGAGILAGARENKRVKDDRAQHSREVAQGKTIDPQAKRRQEMESTRYESVSAGELIDSLGAHLEEGALDTDDALQAALDQLAAVETREFLSDSRKIDLISYSSAVAVEDERFRLALARAQVKSALGRKLDADARQRLSLDDSQSINELIGDRRDQFIELHETDISAKDQAFQRLRRRRIATAAATGVAAGLTFGLASQEIVGALSDSREGLLEQLWSHDSTLHNGSEHRTLLDGLLGGGGEPGEPSQVIGDNTSYSHETFGTDTRYTISDNITMREDSDGSVLIVGADGKTIFENINLRSDGSMSEKTQLLLEQKGLAVEDLSHRVSEVHNTVKEVSLHDYMDNHQQETTRITRDVWYDNNTVAPTFEQNELGLQWGGDNGSGVAQDGHIQFNVSAMDASGSYHDNMSTNWADDARDGNLKLAISPSGDTQAQPFLVDVNPNGTVNIPEGSPAAEFFTVKDGHAVFEGKYAEVVQMMGKDNQGVEHVRPLATYVGSDNIDTLKDTVTTKTHEMQHHYKITAPPIEVSSAPAETFTEMAPVIPIVGRRSLENTNPTETSPYYYGYNLTPQEVRRFREEECSPRLNRNPQARLNPREELTWRRQKMTERQGTEYVGEIDTYIDSSTELRDLSPNTKAIVTIPVAASSEQENIYKTLTSYANQDELLDSTTILLHVNWFDRPKHGSKTSQAEHEANIQKTFAEIERAKQDYPQLNVAIMQTQWERDREASGEYGDGIIGHVARRMYDAAMMATERQMRSGRLDGSKDVLLIRNDSDAQGIQRTYLKHMVEAMQQHPENDVFTGAIRWGTERHKDLPGLGVVSNFREIMHILSSRKGIDTWPPTVGINTAIRMSTFAAVGSVGDSTSRTGIGTDDYNIGGRIKDARQPSPSYGQRRGYYDYGRQPQSGNGSKGGYGTRGLVSTDDFSYHRHVVGATIDTAPDRLERSYVNGVPIHDAWSNWDNTTRTEGLEVNSKESVGTEAEAARVIEKIENDFTVAISHRFINRRQVMAGLAFVLPDPRYYRLKPSRDKIGASFELTADGKKYLIKRLQRGGKGQFDPYGNRVRRALYNEIPKGAKKQPVPSKPALV